MNTGTVIKSTGSQYLVQSSGQIYTCSLRGKFKTKGFRSTNPIAVGDKVDFEFDEHNKSGVITNIHPRLNQIMRRSTNLSRYAHIIAANIDYAFLVVSLKNPKTYPEFIDRFLVSAEYHQIETVIIFNKTDIYEQDEMDLLHALEDIYQTAGYKTLSISVVNNINIDKVEALIKNKTVLISGNSGVGKSTLINRLNPELNLKTAEISDYHKQGMHTTTFAEMHPVAGGWLIDTPGIKGFGITDINFDELSLYFREMNIIRKACKFNNCSHTHEPDCAVKNALISGEISESRYNSYLSILNDRNEDKYRLDIYK